MKILALREKHILVNIRQWLQLLEIILLFQGQKYRWNGCLVVVETFLVLEDIH